jgi:hypothetical protein
MAAPVAAIYVLLCREDEGVDGRNKSGHDSEWIARR